MGERRSWHPSSLASLSSPSISYSPPSTHPSPSLSGPLFSYHHNKIHFPSWIKGKDPDKERARRAEAGVPR